MAAPFDLGAYYLYLGIFVAVGLLIYYFWQLRSMFPVWELKRGGDPVAIFVNMAGQIKLFKIKDFKGRTFSTRYGSYQLADDYRYQCGKRDVYFYFIGHANPVSIESMGKVMSYLYEKKLPTLTINDIKNIAMDDKKPLSSKIGARGLQFLDGYYNIDMYAKADVVYDASTKKRFHIENSRGVIPFRPQAALFWRKVLIVAINDRLIDIVKAKIEQQFETDKATNEPVITSYVVSEYGRIKVTDARTRYKKGKTDVYLAAVKSIQEPIAQ